jgi:hypothetical protein
MGDIAMSHQVTILRKLWAKAAWRLAINWILVIIIGTLLHQVQPASSDTHIALGVLATVLGLLAAGIFTAYNSLSMEDAPKQSLGLYNTIDAVVFCCMYLLLYLSVFCLYRIGIQFAVGGRIELILHIALGLLLSAMHLVDVWDRIQNAKEATSSEPDAD